jgi:hypothetical protein
MAPLPKGDGAAEEVSMAERGRTAAQVAVIGLLALLPRPAAEASGVDGAGRLMVVPLAYAGQPRDSIVTLTNPNPEPVRVRSWYVGAEGTPKAASKEPNGPPECVAQQVPEKGSVTRRLRDLCPFLDLQDQQNFGYLWLTSDADASENVFVTTTVDAPGVSSGIAGQPVGAYDPGFAPIGTAGLEVGGLRTRKAQDESPSCFLGTLNEAKKLSLDLLDPTGAPLGPSVAISLPANRMERVDLEAAFALADDDRDGLRLTIASADDTQLIAGCGAEYPATNTIAYQPAQSPEPADRSRLHSVVVHAQLEEGPYSVGAPFWHTAFGAPADRKVVLSTYLRSDDEIRCVLQPWPQQAGGFDTTPWTEIQIRDPLGTVVGGGSGAKDTKVVTTRSRGAYPAGVSQRYTIEISFDESGPSLPWPSQVAFGPWQVACVSAAGMSQPLGVPIAALDDF